MSNGSNAIKGKSHLAHELRTKSVIDTPAQKVAQIFATASLIEKCAEENHMTLQIGRLLWFSSSQVDVFCEEITTNPGILQKMGIASFSFAEPPPFPTYWRI